MKISTKNSRASFLRRRMFLKWMACHSEGETTEESPVKRVKWEILRGTRDDIRVQQHPRRQESSAYKFLPLISLGLAILLFSTKLFAQTPPGTSPHKDEAVKTGIITGKLLNEANEPVGEHTIILEIMRGDALILTIPKPTEKDGGYQFKNIFQSPEFSYSVSTEYNGENFSTGFISLNEGEDEKELNLVIGKNAAAATSQTCPTCSPIDEYQLLALLLTIFVIGFVIYQRKRRK